ncbi:MAG: PEP-CTERM sorting domain-containing protein [Verrucomicrobiales bacterium]|nr:PEP-CTERM sorting domain-containing protein [Verrucomicrobiales bacterium]
MKTLTLTLAALLTLAVTISAQPIAIPDPPNPATGPNGGGVGSDGLPNAFNEPVPGFIGPAGDGKAAYLYPENYLNPIFVGWATGVVPGSYRPSNGVAQRWQVPSRALGPVSGDIMDIVTLGELFLPYNVTVNGLTIRAPEAGQRPPYVDGDRNYKPYSGDPADLTDGWDFVGYDQPGTITLSFASPIVNGSGADFVVFENAFVANEAKPEVGIVAGGVFAELAYVEVSTDNIHFARFPSVSLTAGPANSYGNIDPSNVYNLAGASCNGYGESWGTSFNLDDLLADPDALALIADGYLDLDNIIYIKIIDIPGCGYYTDSLGNPIYDAWSTVGSGGFDLDAIGVLHNRESEYGEHVATAATTALSLSLSQSLTMSVQPIPEPSTWALLFISTVGLLLAVKFQTPKFKFQVTSKSQ